MSCPFSSFFSQSISGNQELTSDLPRRSLLEMSNVSPVAAVSTPPVPLFCSLRLSSILENLASCIRYSDEIACHEDYYLFFDNMMPICALPCLVLAAEHELLL
uniref:Uncharacterized protein n=1 Tax=Periophthalmus magnuspinnatus TaxID=409849 RepID=A0A3B4AXT0_9GOBI